MTVMKEMDSRMEAIHIVWILPIICALHYFSINIIYHFAAWVCQSSFLVTMFLMHKKNKAVDIHGDAIIRSIVLKEQHGLIIPNHDQEVIQHMQVPDVL